MRLGEVWLSIISNFSRFLKINFAQKLFETPRLCCAQLV